MRPITFNLFALIVAVALLPLYALAEITSSTASLGSACLPCDKRLASGAGLRVVDLCNPSAPKEVAYFKPGESCMTRTRYDYLIIKIEKGGYK